VTVFILIVQALGIPMGAPLHQVLPFVEQKGLHLFSANLPLYGDISSRVMQTLSQFSPKPLEVYSIDEAWLNCSAIPRADQVAFAQDIRQTIDRWVGVPVSIGVAATKALSKVAMEVAKERPDGVYALSDETEIDTRLSQMRVEDLWGISSGFARRLAAGQVRSALEFKCAPDGWIRQQLGIVGLRLAHELRGISCLPLESVPPRRKQLMHSRAFGRDIDGVDDLIDAITHYTVQVAERLRQHRSLANVLGVFLSTNGFRKDQAQDSRSGTVHLAAPTNHTPTLLAVAQRLAQRLYQPGYAYHRAGVYLLDLVPDTHQQLALFDVPPETVERQRKAMTVLDQVNATLGRGTLTFASALKAPAWKPKQAYLSKHYTTRMDELPFVW
jgi:DNA polymerase V